MKWGSHINKITKNANSTFGFLRWNLKHCPASPPPPPPHPIPPTSCLSLIRSFLEYSSIVLVPHLLITGDYNSRDKVDCVNLMLQDLALPPLRDRRKTNRLIFIYKMVEGLVPALQCHDILTPVCAKRHIKSSLNSDFVPSTIIERQSTNNSKCSKLVQCNTELFWN